MHIRPSSVLVLRIRHLPGTEPRCAREGARVQRLLAARQRVSLAARAQQPERMRRIGILLAATADDAEFQARVGAFLQALALFGWTIGRDVRIDTRWATANVGEIRRHAAEFAALAPDVVLAHRASTVGPMLQATRTVPMVFPVAADPGRRWLRRQPRGPGRNATVS